jgi:hypothetical protein
MPDVIELASAQRHLQNPAGGDPADRHSVTLRYTTVKRFRDGRLVSEHLYFDQLEVPQ